MRTKTERGFIDYGAIKGLHDSTIEINESSIAFKGAHAWLRIHNPSLTNSGYGAMQLSVPAIKELILSLQEFVDDAEQDKLIEPAIYND